METGSGSESKSEESAAAMDMDTGDSHAGNGKFVVMEIGGFAPFNLTDLHLTVFD